MKNISKYTEEQLVDLIKEIDDKIKDMKHKVRLVLYFCGFIFCLGLLILIWVNPLIGFKVISSTIVAAIITMLFGHYLNEVYNNKEEIIKKMIDYDIQDRKFRSGK